MAKVFTTWTVLPHGPLEKLSENLWRLEGTMPDGTTKRVMSLVRLQDGRILLHNAIALEEDLMAEIQGWGTPAAILVPNGFHRQDARIMKDRFSEAKVYCPTGATKAVTAVVPVDGNYDAAPQDESVKVRHLAGMKEREGVVEVSSEDGRSVIFCDTLLNLKDAPHVFKLFLSPLGRPSVPLFMRWFLINQKKALKADLETMAAQEGLRRLIPGHGQMVDSDARTALSTAAAGLG